MAYKVQIQYDDPMPECCSDCRFNYDYLYCELDDDKQVTVHDDEGRPQHCKLMLTVDVREVMASAWIPVSERLPEVYTLYLVTLDDGTVYFLYWEWHDDFKHWGDAEGNDDYIVKAWMPLPEPFKP